MRLRIILLMLVAFLLQITYLFQHYNLWWDASIYLGMGHYIFSLGKIGIWEPIRPLVWPLILGFFWKIGFNDIWIGKLITIAFSLGSVYLTYLIGKKVFEKEAASIAAMLLAFTSVFFYFSFKLCTEIPSVFFALLAVYFFIDNKPIFAGAFSAIAFLTKFPQVLIFLVFIFVSLRNFKKLLKIGAAFGAVVLPYFILNFVMYGNPIIPLLWASEIVQRAGAWLFSGPWYYYFIEILKQNVLYIFAVIGFFVFIKRKQKALVFILVLFFIYFSTHVHKEIRFGLLFLPYLSLMAAVGIKKLFKQKWMFWVLAILSLFLLFMNFSTDYPGSQASQDYYSFLDGIEDVDGEILTMHPKVNIYSPKVVEPMYFMVFDSELAQKWIDYIGQNKDKISYVFLDTCEGGMLCPPGDANCEEKKEELIALLQENYETAYHSTSQDCEYWVFKESS